MLPLDLHVLSLPLAFILSQDQTLHCNISFLKYPLKINPVSSKTQSKSLGFWRDRSRLCATTSSLIQRTFPFFEARDDKDKELFSLHQTFHQSFLTFFSAFRERIPRVQSVKYAFQGTCFSSKAGTKVLNDFNKTNYRRTFFILFSHFGPPTAYSSPFYILSRYNQPQIQPANIPYSISV